MIKNSLLGLSLLLGLCSLIISLRNLDRKTVYVDTGKIYREFALSKELDKEMEMVVKTRKHILDSLYRQLKLETEAYAEARKKDERKLQQLKLMEQEYLYKQDEFGKENQAAAEAYSEKIWSQINQYVQDYSIANNYSFMLGANGQGNIMYGKNENDITDEIVTYLNQRYNGEVK